MISEEQKLFFEQEGYLVFENLISKSDVDYYSNMYNSFLDNSIDASRYRSDLSGGDEKKEKITQIMVPSKLVPELLQKPIHQKSLEIAKILMGDDIELDFDMLINKAPNTNTITPWHQDAAYWIDMPDKRAASCWVAIDHAYRENGCMWYTPKSHLSPILPHVQIGNKGALKCEGTEENSVFIELQPGSCVFHQGGTLHYSRGNSTDNNRRALITNFRPKAMIDLERAQGVDHTGEREVKN
ncbi:phytanoyl-CoA dioxygenase family protein [Maribacter algarum]|uniref:Phytanoyl-CoA dioxygenase family protein n=1 Tax=Maribacter algarum (ex Zhang et al. 2020) TaxID=2578118 RepID=A0A5S3PVQ1_9FLAO|nr:phytanoyl-CoA dioxygenase family protein [Maribacter algarum]TMM59010.1 phytanoyl-CoA dioxygenase family protein [Maribacter algarum]